MTGFGLGFVVLVMVALAGAVAMVPWAELDRVMLVIYAMR